MRRRQFVGQLGAMGLGAMGAGAFVSCGRNRSDEGPKFWTWVHGGRERAIEEWQREFVRLRGAGIRGVLVSGGDTAILSRTARDAGLEFHRWIWTLNRSGDRRIRQEHPEWFTVSRNGDSSLVKPPYVGYYQWLCPTRPPVRDYLRGVVSDLAADPSVDGVHLDYVRHCDVILPLGLWSKYGLVQDRELPEFDFCYCEVCREAFAAQTGTDPLGLPDPAADEAWRRFRWDSVTGCVRALADAVHAHGKPITAAVFPTPDIARRLVRQSWDEWPLDGFFPMIYHAFYEKRVPWIGAATAEDVAALDGRAPVYSGLYLPDLPPADCAAAVRQALTNGADGVSLFEAGGLSDEHLEVLRTTASAE